MSNSTALERATQLRRAGSFDEAVIVLESLLAAEPENPLALVALAEVQLRRGRLAEADAALDRAEAAAGTTAAVARLRGEVHYRGERWQQAAAAYQQAEALGSKDTWLLVQLARCRIRLRDPAGAKGALASALERDPKAAAAWVLLGDLAREAGDLDEAERLFARAHELAPADQFAYAKLVQARLLRLPEDRRDREIDVLLRGGGKDNPHLLGLLARLRSERQDDEGAARVWRQRAERHGGDAYARRMEGFALRRAGRLDEAAPLLRAALLADPESNVLFGTFVHLEHARGAHDELRETLEQLLPLAGARRGRIFAELRKLDALGEAAVPPGSGAP